MSSAIHVHSIQALTRFAQAIKLFREDAQHAIDEMQKEWRETMAYLERRLVSCASRLEQEKRLLHELERKYAYTDQDDRFAVVALQSQIAAAERKIKQLEAEYAHIERWIGQVQTSGTRFMNQAQRFSNLAESDLVKGVNMLVNSVNILQKYAAGENVGETIGAAATQFWQQWTGKISSDAVRNTSGSGLESWTDSSILDIDIDQLPVPEGITGPEDFDHHITYEEAIKALRRYKDEVEPLVKQGVTAEEFSDLDAVHKLDYEHGRRRVYDLFYGNDPIYIEKNEERYDIINGRHRLFVARMLGWKTIPVRLKQRNG